MTRKQLAAAIVFSTIATALVSHSSSAQARSRIDLGGMPQVGGEAEQYARVLELAGFAPPTSWSIQPFSQTQVSQMRPTHDHPWRARYDTATRTRDFFLLRPKARIVENSSFAFMDAGEHAVGPAWTGRGVTGEAQAGFAGFWKHVSFQFAPVGFIAQNQPFDIEPNNQVEQRIYADGRSPITIDMPQRFGSGNYHRLDLGNSWLTVDGFGLTGGFSSSPNHWGPAVDFPLVLGPNAGGFPSLFFGTSKPADLWLVTVQMRMQFGQLTRSAYAPARPEEARRLGSGAVVEGTVRGLPNLQVGATRFIHVPWPGQGFSLNTLGRPFSNGLNLTDVAKNLQYENQLASAFFRWVFPSVHTEFYGEIFRDDFPGKFHQALSLIEKPDDLATYTLGVQNVFRASGDELFVWRAEIVNSEISHQERTERGFNYPIRPYVHDIVNEGHTQNGLVLGSPDAYGGSGWRLALEKFTPKGRSSITFERSLRLDFLPVLPAPNEPLEPDVIYALRLETLRFAGARDLTFTLIPAIDLNRDLRPKHDIFNLYAAITVRGLR